MYSLSSFIQIIIKCTIDVKKSQKLCTALFFNFATLQTIFIIDVALDSIEHSITSSTKLETNYTVKFYLMPYRLMSTFPINWLWMAEANIRIRPTLSAKQITKKKANNLV